MDLRVIEVRRLTDRWFFRVLNQTHKQYQQNLGFNCDQDCFSERSSIGELIDVFACDNAEDGYQLLSKIFMIEDQIHKIARDPKSYAVPLQVIASQICNLVDLKYVDGNPLRCFRIDQAANVYATLRRTLAARGSWDDSTSNRTVLQIFLRTRNGEEFWRAAVLYYGDAMPVLPFSVRRVALLSNCILILSFGLLSLLMILSDFGMLLVWHVVLGLFIALAGILCSVRLTTWFPPKLAEARTVRDLCRIIAARTH
jgi:hypothetical protein